MLVQQTGMLLCYVALLWPAGTEPAAAPSGWCCKSCGLRMCLITCVRCSHTLKLPCFGFGMAFGCCPDGAIELNIAVWSSWVVSWGLFHVHCVHDVVTRSSVYIAEHL
jgi:hypothetical protein